MCTNHVEVWKGMEQAVREKLTKNIGVSNFNIRQMERLLENCKIRPTCLQVEMHTFLQEVCTSLTYYTITQNEILIIVLNLYTEKVVMLLPM